MQFGDVVRYTRNGVTQNALVLESRVIGVKEHLTLGYLVGQGTRAEMVKAFDIVPLQEGAKNGWKEIPEPWKETAAQFSRNADYYRGLVVEIGEMFGEAAYVSDDGSKQQDVLCAKVPQLVRSAVMTPPAPAPEAKPPIA